MKNQYFGDVNDYLKYGLLRTICQATGLQLAVCWMLTPDDGRTDGKKTGYTDKSSQWRKYDPDLFDVLKDAVKNGRRSINVAENTRLLPRAAYHSDILQDDRQLQCQYFNRLQMLAASSDLVFFDPDNGMEVRSKSKGCKESSKYLYWDDTKQVCATGKSLVVYQHFARVKRDVFIAGLQQRFGMETGASWVGALVTSNVVYFVVPAPAHEVVLRNACDAVCRQWEPHIWMA